MNRKIIDLKHHLASGCCMWSGIEDVYVTRINQKVPEAFLFALSSFGETAFIKTGDKKRPYMFSAADGRTRKTYDRIKDILGLEYKISEGRTVSYALSSIKKEIDNGNPVILGPLDMYYLPYLKMYHKYHVPIHYVVMAGYNSDRSSVYIYDCDRIELQELPESDLIQAWQVERSAVGDKNGFIRFKLSDSLLDPYELARLCLQNKADRQLCTKPDFVGVNAYAKMARIIPEWKEQFQEKEYKNLLVSITEGLGMVPKLPNPIIGVVEEDISYEANYDRFGAMLIELGEEYKQSNWVSAGKLFQLCGKKLEAIVNYIVQYYLDGSECSDEIQKLFIDTGRCAAEAYELIKEQASH